MNRKKQLGAISRLLAVIFCLNVIALLPQPSVAQTITGEEVFTGTIIFIPGPTVGGPGTTRAVSRTFTLRLNCTTPNAEINRLVGILNTDGQDALLNAITNQRCGVIQFGANVGHDINVVRVANTEEGERKITMLFERWLEFFEVRYGLRSRDFPFTYIEVYVNDKGKVEGTMIPAARIRFIDDNNTVQIENFAAFPARLTGMQR